MRHTCNALEILALVGFAVVMLAFVYFAVDAMLHPDNSQPQKALDK